MGTQVVLHLAAELISKSAYGPKLKRIALLDHYWSKGQQDYLPKVDPGCWFWCDNYSPGQYAREVLMKIIRDDNDNPPVSA